MIQIDRVLIEKSVRYYLFISFQLMLSVMSGPQWNGAVCTYSYFSNLKSLQTILLIKDASTAGIANSQPRNYTSRIHCMEACTVLIYFSLQFLHITVLVLCWCNCVLPNAGLPAHKISFKATSHDNAYFYIFLFSITITNYNR